MIFKNEEQLLKIIKYIPTFFLIIISLLILSFLYIENIKTFNEEKNKIQSNYILKNKEQIKERVNYTYNYILHMQKTTEEELKKSLKDEMQRVYSIAYSIYENNKDTKSDEEIKKLIKDVVRTIRFNHGRGYFFIHDKSTFSNTMHPIMPSLEGKNSYNVKDARGEYIIRQMHEKLKVQDETVLQWYWYKPNEKETQYKKIGYIKNFEPFNWFIGTGEYVKDFEKQVQEKVLEGILNTNYDKSAYMFVITYKNDEINYLKKGIFDEESLKSDLFKDGIKKIVDKAKDKKSTFYTYNTLSNSKEHNGSRKTSYLKVVDNWSWVIGTGFYEDDVNSEIKKKKEELDNNILIHMKNTILVAIVLVIILLFSSIYLSRTIKRKFNKYKNEIDQHLQNKVEQERILFQQAKMASMGEMIENIAHQWRQPLSNISSNATSLLVQKEMNVLEDDTLKNNLQSINKKAQYLSKTIDDFRNFFSSNKYKNTFSIKTSIEESLILLDSQFKNNDIVIIQDIEAIEIKNYKNEFIQVIINILNNAKDVLVSKHKDRFIFINAYKNDEKLVIKIKDSGGGINKDIAHKIFDPYFTTKHQGQGTGIGLYMSNEIITKHMNGTINFTNEEFLYQNKIYKGAQFELIIPLNK
ncbi:sensor histidine kinase [Poseidonibacter sp.]|uniref:sensor histidine kinase n=1 Tax=Poseidonibacter sp. TaxID=2321188 RepID=UPI003C76B28D